MAFYKGNIICQHKVHREFCCIFWRSLPKSNPTAEGNKEQKAWDKPESFILADKLKSSSAIAPIAQQVKCISSFGSKTFSDRSKDGLNSQVVRPLLQC